MNIIAKQYIISYSKDPYLEFFPNGYLKLWATHSYCTQYRDFDMFSYIEFRNMKLFYKSWVFHGHDHRIMGPSTVYFDLNGEPREADYCIMDRMIGSARYI